MSTQWKKVESKCHVCNIPVAKITIKAGKIVVDEYFDCWGAWHKVPHKSEMQVECSACQKKLGKEQRRQQRWQARQKKM